MKSGYFVLFVLFLYSVPAWSQDLAPMQVDRVNGPIQLDGLPFEPAWDAIEPLPLIQYEPNPGEPATEQTEIRIAYDDEYIYFSMRAYDSDKTGIRANTLYRDDLSGDDHFEILLDTFNDNETGLVFTTTPAGIRREAAVSNDASGAFSAWLNVSFNTFWDVKSVVDERGWFTELRIPFSSLRFQDDNGRVVMGFSVQRKIARRSERLIYPPVSPSISWGFLKPSLARKIVFEGVYSRKPLYVTPYALSGLEHASGFDALDKSWGEDEFKREIGVDLKYGITNNLTLDLTVNTDFAQVEADDQLVNLTRFSLFYPEKRQFFQERAGIFEFNTGGLSRLFHSRRIGLTDDGQPVRLLGGARVVGRVGDWDLGFINMQTDEYRDIPSENFGVLRVRRRFLNDYSFAGGMVTNRIGLDGTYSTAYGLDSNIRLFGDDYLSIQWAQTFDDRIVDSDDLNGINSGRVNALVERRRRQGFGYATGLTWSGPHFNPGLGFIQRSDFSMFDQTVSYSWIPGLTSSLLWHTLGFQGAVYLRNQDRSVETAEIGPEYTFGRRSGSTGTVELKMIYEDLLFPFSLSNDAVVPAGSYTFYQANVQYRMPQTSLKQMGLNLNVGSFYDGHRISAGFTPAWYVSKHLRLSGEYTYNLVRFPDRDQRFDAHIARLRIGTALNTALSTNAFVQYNSASRAFSANVRFRYNFREGNDLWIVFSRNDWVNMRPVLPLADTQTILLKYTYTFDM